MVRACRTRRRDKKCVHNSAVNMKERDHGRLRHRQEGSIKMGVEEILQECGLDLFCSG
jgi:hypothetical protein